MERSIFSKRVDLATAALLALGMAGGGAQAQTTGEGQSCGGLVCDLGLFGLGRPDQPAPAAPPAQPAPVVAAPAAPAPAVAAATRAHAARRLERPAVVQAARAKPPRKLASTTRQAARMEPHVAMPELPLPASMEEARLPAKAPPDQPAPSAPSQPVVLANPFTSSAPAPTLFQPVDPFYHGE